MADLEGGVFDRKEQLIQRLRQGPGEEAKQEIALNEKGPPPSRWTLRTIRVTFNWLKDYTLSGVWRLLRRYDLRLEFTKEFGLGVNSRQRFAFEIGTSPNV